MIIGMKKVKSKFRNIPPAIIGAVIFIILFIASNWYTNYKKGLWEKDIRSDILHVLTGKKSMLEKALFSRIYYTRGVAAFVALKPEITDDEFSKLAQEYIKNDTVINTMALSKDCILNAIYPFEGHETAIGLNLLEHPERKTMVEKTIETHLTFVAGPVELVEGGIAFISYTPIFDQTQETKDIFWGVTDIVIKQNSLLNEATLFPEESGYKFALKGENGSGENGRIFWGDSGIFDNNPVKVHINLPIGSWVLAAVPSKGWTKYDDQNKVLFFILLFSAFIISILIWLFTRALLQIKYNEKELKAIFASMDSLVVEFNSQGEYLKISSANEDLLYLPKDDLIGKKLTDVFDHRQADYFMKSIQTCLKEKRLVIVDYPLEIKGKKHWFAARISYKTDDSVIFNVYDVTQRKEQEEQLLESEQKLLEINNMKDRFFSILAHDLRNPVGGQVSLINLILEQLEDLEEAELKTFLQELQESSLQVHELLENLLEWSKSQSGKITANIKTVQLYEMCSALQVKFKSDCKNKSINLINDVPENLNIKADKNLLETILRNLVSNAIKFTKSRGSVTIATDTVTIDKQLFYKISVTDNGIGIRPNILKKLFRMDAMHSTIGTQNEKGSGLGLILCQEFAVKMGTTIEVESEVGKGSTFSLLLPSDEASI